MEGVFATRCAFSRETTRSEREKREKAERSTATHGASQSMLPLMVPVPMAVPKAVGAFCVIFFVCKRNHIAPAG